MSVKREYQGITEASMYTFSIIVLVLNMPVCDMVPMILIFYRK